jgi:hypothetical protein
MKGTIVLVCLLSVLAYRVKAQKVVYAKYAYKQYLSDGSLTLYLGAESAFKHVLVRMTRSTSHYFSKPLKIKYLYVTGRLRGNVRSPYVRVTKFSQVIHESIPIPLTR